MTRLESPDFSTNDGMNVPAGKPGSTNIRQWELWPTKSRPTIKNLVLLVVRLLVEHIDMLGYGL